MIPLLASRCTRCGCSPTDTERFACTDCGRPLGVCSNPGCGWCVRLFNADDPADCDGCGWREKDPEENAQLLAGNGPCPGCGGPPQLPSRPLLDCSFTRWADAMTQMTARSGPIHEKSKDRGKVLSAAWRAAGSPPRVIRVGEETRIQYYLYAPWKRESQFEEATPEQVEAWYSWNRERARLIRENGWD